MADKQTCSLYQVTVQLEISYLETYQIGPHLFTLGIGIRFPANRFLFTAQRPEALEPT
jgi:hypothetical protein